MWKLHRSLETSCTGEEFFSGVAVWVRRPNVLNRKLVGVVSLLESSLSPEAWGHLDLTGHHVTVRELSAGPLQSHEGTVSQLLVRECLPRERGACPSHELVVIDCEGHSATFIQLKAPSEIKMDIDESHVCPEVAYQFLYTTSVGASKISLLISEQYPEFPCVADGITVPKVEWLAGVLLPKILQWSQEGGSSLCEARQFLIPLDRYTHLYQHLKEKYGQALVKNWPERTDPLKYVYEDIAIATYLLVLWEEERNKQCVEKKQSFLDLGCGNGLLVHLLTSEGHPGKGLDLRRRKVWSMYGEGTVLQVSALTPSPHTVFPDTDWLIGNHSDELTPWLPVMAARSSYTTSFFVLPCCAHDFNRKFHREGSGRSQYRFYLDYVREIGEKMGFKVHEDMLRIPSSKKVCLIGQQRTYPAHQEAAVDVLRQQFLDERCGQPQRGCEPQGVTPGGRWVSGFAPRESKELVKNCSQVDRGVSQYIAETIASSLLQTECLVSVEDAQVCGHPSQLGAGPRKWNLGGRLHLGEAVKMFDKEVLSQLKRECGGLQTLLRNWHQVFHVYGGFIHLRNWATWDQSPDGRKAKACCAPQCEAKQLLIKTKPCWFHTHHPQGCPRAASNCPYAHGLEELRNRPNFSDERL